MVTYKYLTEKSVEPIIAVTTLIIIIPGNYNNNNNNTHTSYMSNELKIIVLPAISTFITGVGKCATSPIRATDKRSLIDIRVASTPYSHSLAVQKVEEIRVDPCPLRAGMSY